jgi:hypothetical protein
MFYLRKIRANKSASNLREMYKNSGRRGLVTGARAVFIANFIKVIGSH